MQGKRLDRVNQLIKEEISLLLQRGLKDPGLGFVSVTEVDVSKDLRTARVYVSVLGAEETWQSSLAALERARGYIRAWLTPRLRLRMVPHFTFLPDRSMAHAARIQKLLAELRGPGEPGPGEEGPAADAPGPRPGPDGP
jgi:ribosome-binding factor A